MLTAAVSNPVLLEPAAPALALCTTVIVTAAALGSINETIFAYTAVEIRRIIHLVAIATCVSYRVKGVSIAAD